MPESLVDALSRAADPMARVRTVDVLLLDAQPLTRAALAEVLRRGGLTVREEDGAAPAPVAHSAGAVLLRLDGDGDLREPALADAVERILARLTAIPAAVIVPRDDTALALHAVRRHGLRGFLPATLRGDDLVAAVRLVIAGGIFIGGADGAGGQPIVPSDGGERLTAREAEVLDLLRQGKSNKIIAWELAMAENTVKVHVRRILSKLGAANRTQVAFLPLP